MRQIDKLLKEYGESHQTIFNKKIHYVCVPAIFFSLIGLLASIYLGDFVSQIQPHWVQQYIHLGTLVVLLGLIYYLRLSFKLFLGMLVFSVFVLYGITFISSLNIAPLWFIMLVVFVVAWVFQFIGHKHEGKKPSFIKDLQFLLIGPAWTLSHLFDYFKIKF